MRLALIREAPCRLAPMKAGPDEAGPDEAGPDEAGPLQVGRDQAGLRQLGPHGTLSHPGQTRIHNAHKEDFCFLEHFLRFSWL